MKRERSDVEFAVWRKAVDKSLFEQNGTTIPAWACRMWGLKEMFGAIATRRDPTSAVTVTFKDRAYRASVTTAAHGRKPAIRLFYDPELSFELKHTFLMSYMRSLEGALRSLPDVEKHISFWEFLDIEFDRDKRLFCFKAFYTVLPAFPSLFQRLVGSPAIKRVEDDIAAKGQHRIYKQGWKPKAELELELGAKNVIYMLFDSTAKHIYVGEAADLVKRLLQPHPSIPTWDHFRYNVLPPNLEPFRVALERMLIRDFAAVLTNKGAIDWRDISGFSLCNDRIDK